MPIYRMTYDQMAAIRKQIAGYKLSALSPACGLIMRRIYRKLDEIFVSKIDPERIDIMASYCQRSEDGKTFILPTGDTLAVLNGEIRLVMFDETHEIELPALDIAMFNGVDVAGFCGSDEAASLFYDIIDLLTAPVEVESAKSSA